MDTVIFDFNGLFLKFEKGFVSRLIEDFNLDKQEVVPVIINLMNNVRRPNAPKIYELFKPFLDKWGINFSEQDLLTYWFEPEKPVYEMVELVKDLKQKQNKVFILSNNFKDRYLYRQEYFDLIDNLCDGSYYSWKTGFVKPHKDAFNFVLSVNQLLPEQCLFFDDSMTNVIAAEDLGIKSFLFQSVNKTREILQQNKLL